MIYPVHVTGRNIQNGPRQESGTIISVIHLQTAPHLLAKRSIPRARARARTDTVTAFRSELPDEHARVHNITIASGPFHFIPDLPPPNIPRLSPSPRNTAGFLIQRNRHRSAYLDNRSLLSIDRSLGFTPLSIRGLDTPPPPPPAPARRTVGASVRGDVCITR